LPSRILCNWGGDYNNMKQNRDIHSDKELAIAIIGLVTILIQFAITILNKF